MKLRKWTGQVDQDVFADLIYPKDTEEGTVRLVLRAPSGRIKASILDFNVNTGITTHAITDDSLKDQMKNALTPGGFPRTLKMPSDAPGTAGAGPANAEEAIPEKKTRKRVEKKDPASNPKK